MPPRAPNAIAKPLCACLYVSLSLSLSLLTAHARIDLAVYNGIYFCSRIFVTRKNGAAFSVNYDTNEAGLIIRERATHA